MARGKEESGELDLLSAGWRPILVFLSGKGRPTPLLRTSVITAERPGTQLPNLIFTSRKPVLCSTYRHVSVEISRWMCRTGEAVGFTRCCPPTRCETARGGD